VARPRGVRLTEAETRDLRVRQGNLSALAEHPAWAALQTEVGRKLTSIEKLVARQVIYGESLSPERQAYLKGFAAGLRWMAVAPTQAEGALERFLAAHGVTRQEEGEDAA
jgi:hypothetical protein